MTRGNEGAVINWLQRQCGKILLPHIGVLTTVEELGKANSNRKKADVVLNGKAISLKQVEGSFLYNRASRKDFHGLLGKTDIDLLDSKVREIHVNGSKRNIPWQEIIPSRDKFKRLLRITMMDLNLSQGLSESPAELILTHPRNPLDVFDICVYTFDEFFEIFSDRWITFAFRRCWPGQSSKSESSRALWLIKEPLNHPWILNGVSGKPKGWSSDAPPVEFRQTCFICSIEVKSPVKNWEELREFKQALLRSGFFNLDGVAIEKITHQVQDRFGHLVYKENDDRWPSVLDISFNEIKSSA